MSPRDTRTGAVLEQMIIPALTRGGYKFEKQVNIGLRPGGKKHIIDVLVKKSDNNIILISLKWQQVQGTAEQKVPFEVICLADALLTNPDKYKKAYLVLGGDAWTLREFYISGGLKKYLNFSELVQIVSLEKFIAFANQSKL